jgi:hypothetical protein
MEATGRLTKVLSIILLNGKTSRDRIIATARGARKGLALIRLEKVKYKKSSHK